ncbi:preprotein translocase subunit SecE [Acidihalobacter ferrooxydans]|uniref:Protein translocase subunit SecE n=1 Tax=Acidihalobacter ferrooxydans TaxID=1765967 RepID=A0A1P8UJS5_9GAMM|nr:preprotein translocase subunit SecE [Acidihalobacter ferrooxydans]APZ44098.1 preprotein translocase subunit SecE [Acidihalobacter ferrooxydans]
MAEKAVSTGSSILDTLKVVVAAALVIVAVLGFYYFSDQMLVIRVLGLLVVVGAAIGVFLTTTHGRRVWRFVADSRTEVRKIVWPTRAETMQVTLVVIAMVIVVGVSLWLLDTFLGWAVKHLMGYGG